MKLTHNGKIIAFTWMIRNRLKSVAIDGRAVDFRKPHFHKKLLTALLARADTEAIKVTNSFEAKLPIPRTTTLKRSISIPAQRLIPEIKSATDIENRMTPEGFGEMVLNLGALRIICSQTEGGRAPAVTINGRTAFSHKSEVRQIAKAMRIQAKFLRNNDVKKFTYFPSQRKFRKLGLDKPHHHSVREDFARRPQPPNCDR